MEITIRGTPEQVINGETDDRGRLALGPEFQSKEVRVVVVPVDD